MNQIQNESYEHGLFLLNMKKIKNDIGIQSMLNADR